MKATHPGWYIQTLMYLLRITFLRSHEGNGRMAAGSCASLFLFVALQVGQDPTRWPQDGHEKDSHHKDLLLCSEQIGKTELKDYTKHHPGLEKLSGSLNCLQTLQ